MNVEVRHVDCCGNLRRAFTRNGAVLSSCTACGSKWCTSSGKPAKQNTYWPLTARSANMLGDSMLGPDIIAGMERARTLAFRDMDGNEIKDLHVWYDGRMSSRRRA